MPVIPLREKRDMSEIETPVTPPDDILTDFKKVRTRLAHVCSGSARPNDPTGGKHPAIQIGEVRYPTFWFGPTAVALSLEPINVTGDGVEPEVPNSLVIKALITAPGYEGQGYARRAMAALTQACMGTHCPVLVDPEALRDQDVNLDAETASMDVQRFKKLLANMGFSAMRDGQSRWWNLEMDRRTES